jgi:hypothetical protein
LQRVLDSLAFSPAIAKTVAWNVVAWNRAAAAVLTDYEALPPERRNILRLFFAETFDRSGVPGWESHAGAAVAAEAARAGASDSVAALVDELSRSSPAFAAIWRDHDVRIFGERTKHMRHPVAGPLTLEYSAFAVDGRPDLGLLIVTPATPQDVARVRSLLEES